jgi:hypothetical protein
MTALSPEAAPRERNQDVAVDFVMDYLKGVVHPAVKALGIASTPASFEEWRRLHYRFCWLRRRQVERRPRKIRVARGFTCPKPVRPGLRILRKKILGGVDLNAHLSRDSIKPNKPDGLYTDWGIHHFHLGIRRDPKDARFVERTGPLLFAWVTEDTVYHIAVKEHGAWTDRDLIETVHANWPVLLAPFETPIAPPSEPSHPTDFELAQARKSVIVCLQIGDKVYAAPGGGVTTAGTSVRAEMEASEDLMYIKSLEDWTREFAVAEFRHQGFRFDLPLELRLGIRGEDAFAVSEALDAALRLPTPDRG